MTYQLFGGNLPYSGIAITRETAAVLLARAIFSCTRSMRPRATRTYVLEGTLNLVIARTSDVHTRETVRP